MKCVRIVIALLSGSLFYVQSNYSQVPDFYEDMTLATLFSSKSIKQTKVRTCSVKYYTLDNGEKSIETLHSQYEFDKQGRIIRDIFYASDERFFEMSHIYDKQGRIIENNWHFADPTNIYSFRYNYEGGVLVSGCSYLTNDTLNYCINYIYDTNNRLIFMKDTLKNNHRLYEYNNGFIYEYFISMKTLNVERAKLIQAQVDVELWIGELKQELTIYKKYKNDLLIENKGQGLFYHYLDDGRLSYKTDIHDYVNDSIVYNIHQLPQSQYYKQDPNYLLQEWWVFSYSYY